MARREVLEVTCDRCGKTETQEPSETTASKLELVVEFQGEKHEYQDLCLRCRRACDGYFKSITKQVAEKGDSDTEEPAAPEEKKGMFGLGGKK